LPFVGKSGWILALKLNFSAIDQEDIILLVGETQEGQEIPSSTCSRFFDLDGTLETAKPGQEVQQAQGRLFKQAEGTITQYRQKFSERAAQWFEQEIEKLERWAQDRNLSLRQDLDRLDREIAEVGRSARSGGTIPERMAKRRYQRELEDKRDELEKAFDAAKAEVRRRKDAKLDDLEQKLNPEFQDEVLFCLRWRVIPSVELMP
jgi:FMN phosphatase YigB (HAD superfamily)